MTGPSCPSCAANHWEQDRPPLGAWGCKSCGAHLCPKPATMQLVHAVGISPELMGGLAREQSVASRWSCPGCGQRMLTFDLKGTPVNACMGCGITAFAAGHLERLVPSMAPLVVTSPGTGGTSPLDVPPVNGLGNPAASAPAAPVGPPTGFGAPPPMSGPADAALSPPPGGGELSQTNRIMMRQATRLSEQLGIERKNDYAIDLGLAGTAHISEDGGGLGGIAIRQFLGARRPMNMSFTDTRSQPRYRITRKFYFFLPTVEVTDASNGAPVGTVHRRFGFLSRKYDLLDARQQVFARIHAGVFRGWKFPLLDRSGREIGAITKKFSGLLKEMVTDSDNFTLELAPNFTEAQRATTLAAAVNLDFEFFEKSSGSKAPLSYIFSGLFFLVAILFPMCAGGGSSGGGVGSAEDLDFAGSLAHAKGCYEAATTEEACLGCCGDDDGAIFRDDDRACLCQGVLARCERADGRAENDDDEAACATCCSEKMGGSSFGDSWIDEGGQCICTGGFNPSTMSD